MLCTYILFSISITFYETSVLILCNRNLINYNFFKLFKAFNFLNFVSNLSINTFLEQLTVQDSYLESTVKKPIIVSDLLNIYQELEILSILFHVEVKKTLLITHDRNNFFDRYTPHSSSLIILLLVSLNTSL